MTSIRIFFLPSVLIFFTSCSIATNNPFNHLETWEKAHLSRMSPQELQLTANFLYLSYAIALVESKVRQLSVPISRLNQSIRKNIAEYQNTTDDLATLKTLLNRLSFVVGARTIYLETLNVCTQYYNTQEHLAINAALEDIQHYAQANICAWANEQTAETNKQLKQSSDIMIEGAQYFAKTAQLQKNLSEGILPKTAPKEYKNYPTLLSLNIILNSNFDLLTATEDITNTINDSYQHAEQLVMVGAHIYKEYYETIHSFITTPTMNKQFATTMFGMHDLLPQEYKTALPDANHVFEHMLQTTKLYTQTELSH